MDTFYDNNLENMNGLETLEIKNNLDILDNNLSTVLSKASSTVSTISSNNSEDEVDYKDIELMNNNVKTQRKSEELQQQKFSKTFKHIKKIIKKYIQKSEEISSKKNKIKTVIEEISKNKKLYFKDHVDNLKFQIELLNNELQYINNLAYSFINKYLNDLIINGQHIIFLLTSLLNYNINDNKNEILSKIKKIDILVDTNKSLGDILTQIEVVISNTNHNISLINDFNKQYDEFIDKITNKFNNENLHCNNLSTSYTFKKKQFDLEYDKNIATLNNIHDYFKTLSNSLNEQIETTIVCNFCLEK
jgi:hypothetical protein